MAIPLPATLRDRLAALAGERPITGVRWLPAENLHVTVQFLGRVEEEALPPLEAALARACAVQAAFALAVERVGPAPPGRRARMIWAHLGRSPGYEALCAAVAAAAASLAPQLSPPARPRAHVTLARFGKPPPAPETLELPPPGPLEPLPVQACALVRSHLSPAGARYETLAELPLGATRPA